MLMVHARLMVHPGANTRGGWQYGRWQLPHKLCAWRRSCRSCRLHTGSTRLLPRPARAREMTNAVHTTATALLHSTRSWGAWKGGAGGGCARGRCCTHGGRPAQQRASHLAVTIAHRRTTCTAAPPHLERHQRLVDQLHRGPHAPAAALHRRQLCRQLGLGRRPGATVRHCGHPEEHHGVVHGGIQQLVGRHPLRQAGQGQRPAGAAVDAGRRRREQGDKQRLPEVVGWAVPCQAVSRHQRQAAQREAAAAQQAARQHALRDGIRARRQAGGREGLRRWGRVLWGIARFQLSMKSACTQTCMPGVKTQDQPPASMLWRPPGEAEQGSGG